jgi:Zn-finger nucleic acid-binding protein
MEECNATIDIDNPPRKKGVWKDKEAQAEHLKKYGRLQPIKEPNSQRRHKKRLKGLSKRNSKKQ